MGPGRGQPPVPPGLIAERIECEGEELVVFSWEQPPAPLPRLSPAERDVLARVLRGESNVTIARARRRSPRTIANQIANLLRKTGSGSRFDLIRRFAK